MITFRCTGPTTRHTSNRHALFLPMPLRKPSLTLAKPIFAAAPAGVASAVDAKGAVSCRGGAAACRSFVSGACRLIMHQTPQRADPASKHRQALKFIFYWPFPAAPIQLAMKGIALASLSIEVVPLRDYGEATPAMASTGISSTTRSRPELACDV